MRETPPAQEFVNPNWGGLDGPQRVHDLQPENSDLCSPLRYGLDTISFFRHVGDTERTAESLSALAFAAHWTIRDLIRTG